MTDQIATAVRAGVNDVVERKYRPMMKSPQVSEAPLPQKSGQSRGKTTMTFSVESPAAARAIVEHFGPMDDENLLTDNLTLPEGIDGITAKARGNKVVLEAEWTAPRAAKPKAVEESFALAARMIGQTAKAQSTTRVSVVEPRVHVSGGDAHGKMTLSYELHDSATGFKLDPARVKQLAGALKMDAASLAAQNIKLPAFVQRATVSANGSNVVFEASW